MKNVFCVFSFNSCTGLEGMYSNETYSKSLTSRLVDRVFVNKKPEKSGSGTAIRLNPEEGINLNT